MKIQICGYLSITVSAPIITLPKTPTCFIRQIPPHQRECVFTLLLLPPPSDDATASGGGCGPAHAATSASVGAAHAPRASALLAGPVGEHAAEPEHGAADLVADGGVALLVMVVRDGSNAGAVGVVAVCRGGRGCHGRGGHGRGVGAVVMTVVVRDGGEAGAGAVGVVAVRRGGRGRHGRVGHGRAVVVTAAGGKERHDCGCS
jgi:hypothetical protein